MRPRAPRPHPRPHLNAGNELRHRRMLLLLILFFLEGPLRPLVRWQRSRGAGGAGPHGLCSPGDDSLLKLTQLYLQPRNRGGRGGGKELLEEERETDAAQRPEEHECPARCEQEQGSE